MHIHICTEITTESCLKFAGVAEPWMNTGPQVFPFFMNFPSATISATGFPLVYPEVNNLWRDKSVCGRELDSQTVELALPPPYNHPATLPPCPNWARPSPRGGLARYLLRTAAWSANLCSNLFPVPVSMFSSCQQRLSVGLCHPCTAAVTGSLTGQWHCPTR